MKLVSEVRMEFLEGGVRSLSRNRAIVVGVLSAAGINGGFLGLVLFLESVYDRHR